MKHLKIASYLLIMITFLTSCEEETMVLSETSETVATKTSETTPPSGNLDFFYNAEDFDCNNLTTQNFEAAINTQDSDYFSSPLNSESDNHHFSPGDILSSISFESAYGFYISDSHDWPTVLMSGGGDDKTSDTNFSPNNDIIINFTTNTVYDVSMMLYGHDNFHAYVEFYGADENYLGNTSVDVDHYDGGYIAVRSLDEPITKIIIKNDSFLKGSNGYYMTGIGSISFGECNDYDGDGCINSEDAYPNSNMSETLSLGENTYEDIDNVKVDCGTFMQDQIDNLINQINDGYNGNAAKSQEGEDNWEELHDAFTTKLAHITYYWRINKLITAGERAEISSDAWSADIPYRDIE